MPSLPCDEGKNWFMELNTATLMATIDWVVENKPTSNVLIIIDDCISTLKSLEKDTEVMNLFYNRRHVIPKGTVSFMITGQKYITFPPKIRSVLTGLLVFRVQGNDWRTIAKENSFNDNDKLVSLMVDEHWKKDSHNFAYFKLDTGDIYLNFSKKI